LSAGGVPGGRGRASRSRALALGVALTLALAALVVGSVMHGPTQVAPGAAGRGILVLLGLADPIANDPSAGNLQWIVELRVWRALVAAGVGAALGLSGGLIQGLFRNGLASPSLLGVTGGASLGAAVAILLLGGYGVMDRSFEPSSLLVPLFSFFGALGAVSLVALLSSFGGRTSVPTLLLIGIAVNMCVAGMFAAIQSLTLSDWEVSRAIMAWTFGTLEDRSGQHAAVVWGALALAATAIPFVAVELDLFQAGEADAQALGVHTGRVKLLCLVAAALSAAAAVAVAGQIAFVGLVVPHLVRIGVGSRHARLLPLCIVAGAVFLLGADLLQRLVFGAGALQPGVMMSLVGGPFFMALLIKNRKEIAAW
jgi:ABC-type Fe3+-siderophore transport system permease subunit